MSRKSGSQGLLIGYLQVMKNIDGMLADRINSVKKLFVDTGKMMLLDFRVTQQNAQELKSRTKGKKAEEVDEDWNAAIEYAKQHSKDSLPSKRMPWTNRTKRALRAVNVIPDADTENISLKLSHGIYYGAYLEYGNNRKYAILEPLVRQYAPGLIAEAKRIMGGA